MVKSTEVENTASAIAVMSTTTAVLNTAPADIRDTPAYLKVQAYLWDNFPAAAEDSTTVYESIIESILAAPDALDLPETLDNATKWAHKPITLLGVETVMPSKHGGIYVTVTVADADGEVNTITIGSPTMLAQLVSFARENRFPLECKIVPIRNGGREGRNPPLYFRPRNY
jgi:hypothetical protein